MRRDHTATDENIKAPNINIHKTNSGGDPSHSRVDINNLLSKVRDDERKQKKENLVFFGLVASVVVITGIIASL